MTRHLLPGLKSQFDRVKETANTMLYYDKTLGEEIQTLFLEQGITIVSIITAIGFAISTIATSITVGIKPATPNPKPKSDPKPKPKPGPKPDPKPTPEPEPTPCSKEWIKNMLEKMTNILIKLGSKALLSLPWIIGAIINVIRRKNCKKNKNQCWEQRFK